MSAKPQAPYLVKLVRDRIGQHLADSTVEYRLIPDRERAKLMLREKLVHEALEYLLDPSIEELADVLEIVSALALHDGHGMRKTQRVAHEKAQERGRFTDLMGMYVQATSPRDVPSDGEGTIRPGERTEVRGGQEEQAQGAGEGGGAEA